MYHICMCTHTHKHIYIYIYTHREREREREREQILFKFSEVGRVMSLYTIRWPAQPAARGQHVARSTELYYVQRAGTTSLARLKKKD